jgi:FkbM family methyltransferase
MLLDLNSLLDKNKNLINGVIHIGANRGQEIPIYENLGIKKIVLFEPLKDNCEILEKNINNKNIKLYKTALGNFNGTVDMFVSDNEQMSSSILRPKEHLVEHPKCKFISTEKVVVNKLNDFKNEVKDCNFINIDVQGFELEVLKGSCEVLPNIDYIYCEVNQKELYENNAFVNDIDLFLSNYNMTRVNTKWTAHGWGDAFYIKNK